ncbi:MAG: hypothetical protein DA408_10490 [Bacteroidetes bacterium]|nr:MAG: hypothetical protein C7N36_11275 [Bacteroidota bacterium]PTM12484.1 MAG: hypothetical protein DA408_10490 [Bacteroidota bacterium]
MAFNSWHRLRKQPQNNKNMKSFPLGLLLGILALSFSSCYEEADWLGDNATPGRGNFPVIATFSTTNGTSFAVGETVNLDLRFFSVAEIDRIALSSIIDGVETEVASFGYTPNFAEDSQTDKLLMTYLVPAVPAGVTKITLKATIYNKNGLTRDRSLDISL